MEFENFIKYVRIKVNNKYVKVELTPSQHAFLKWIERCKEKGLNPFKSIGLFSTYKRK